MKKALKINAKYLPIPFGITNIVAYMYLWDRFTAEWFRTILVLWILFHLILFIVDVYIVGDRSKDLVFKDN